MKYGGNFYGNFSNANGSQNKDYTKDVILDEVARLIELDRPSIIAILRESGYKLDPKASKKEVINYTVRALYNKPQFRNDVSALIVKSNTDFSNANGEWFQGLFGKGDTSTPSTEGGAGAGAGAGAASAIAGAIGAIFTFGTANKNQKAEEERTRQEMYAKLLGNEEKTNWTPIVVVGGVLLLGGVVAFLTLRNKN
jgi:hypothetical protein